MYDAEDEGKLKDEDEEEVKDVTCHSFLAAQLVDFTKPTPALRDMLSTIPVCVQAPVHSQAKQPQAAKVANQPVSQELKDSDWEM